MKVLLAPAMSLFVISAGCARADLAATPQMQSDAPRSPDSVVMAENSPMLRQITRDAVKTASLPTDELIAPGTIDVNPNRLSRVLLPVAGRITSVLVKVGEQVRRDQPLLTIESPDADAAMSGYMAADATVNQAEATLAKAQSDFDRESDLFQHNAVARKDVIAAQNELAQAKAGVQQALAAAEQAARRLTVLGLVPGTFKQQVTVRAPLAGKILDLSVVPGEFRNDLMAPLMTVADLSSVWVTSDVPESYIRLVQVGEPLEISLIAYPGETFQAHVARIADTVDPKTRSVKVQAEIDNRDGRLRPQMYGTIHHIESVATVVAVPAAAIVQDGNRTVVFVEQKPGRFQERDVSIGKRTGDLVRVIDGLHAGESIVIDGAMLLKGMVGAA